MRGRVIADGAPSACGSDFSRSPWAGGQPIPSAAEAAWRTAAETLVPRRPLPGPIDVALALQADHPELLPAYARLNDEAGAALHDGAALLQYWADGGHTIADIADRVELELGQPIGEVALRYFKLLAAAGLVVLKERVPHE